MTLHIGLIGGGNITATHARAVQEIPGAQLVSVYGTNSEKVANLCREHNAAAYTDFPAFLAHRPMDVVVLGSPSGLHAEQGIAAAKQGLHVLTEKPIDISTARADALIAAAQQANVKLGVIFQDRARPQICQLKDWLDQGIIGKPLLIDARVKWYRPPEYYSSSRWRGTFALDGGGALINQAIHTVDLLLWLFGDVVQVQAQVATVLHSIQAEDTALAILKFASGAVATLQATTAAYPGYPRRIEISGTAGTIILEHDRIVATDLRHPHADHATILSGDANKSANSAVVTDVSGHKSVFEDFFHAIRENTAPLCDGQQGRRNLALVEAIYQAAKNSKPIKHEGISMPR
jgi:UDP-N-acetyl-2-amino-2-deoxyglucuronate dehydrogenase